MVSVEALKKFSFFQSFSEPILERLSAKAREQVFRKSAKIIHQHDEAFFVLFLLSGSLQFLIRLKEQESLLIDICREPGTLLGWSAFRAPFRYISTLHCEEDCKVLLIPRQTFMKLFQEDPNFAYDCLRKVAVAVSYRLKKIKERLLQDQAILTNQASREIHTSPSSVLHKSFSRPKEPKSIFEFLQHAPFFENFAENHLSLLSEKAKKISFEKNDYLFHEGAFADLFYILISGKVRLSFPIRRGQSVQRVEEKSKPHQYEIPLRTLQDPGSSIGWSLMVSPFQYQASAQCQTSVEVFSFSKQSIEALIQEDIQFGVQFMEQILWIIGNRLRASRIRLISIRYEKQTLAIRSLIDQHAESLHVNSPLHKIPFYLENKLTFSDAFETLELLRIHGDPMEKNLSGLCLELLDQIEQELSFYQHLQDIYETVVNSPRQDSHDAIRNRCAKKLIKLFKPIAYVIKGEENLPEKPGHIFIMNHLRNHPDNGLPNDFHIILDTHFVASMILFRHYQEAPLRIVRKSHPDEYAHKNYYDHLGYIYVYSGYVDEMEDHPEMARKEQRKFFLDTGKELILKKKNIMICPEGDCTYTQDSPMPFKAGAFRLATYVRPEPLIVPIAVANFDHKITQTKVAAIIHKPFFLSKTLGDRPSPKELFTWMGSYHETYRSYVKEAISLANL